MTDLENGGAVLIDDDEDMQPAQQLLQPIFGFDTVEEFTADGLKQIVKTTKAVNDLPVHGTSRDLYSAHTAFRHVMDVKTERVLQLAHQLIQMQNIKGNIVRREKEEKFDLLQEYNDLMMERININLDEMAGYKKQVAPVIVQAELKETMGVRRGIVNGSWNEKRTSEEMLEKVQSAKLLTAKNIIRPQVNFRVPVDNAAHTPFVPRLQDKPNSIKPLAILPEYDDDGNIESYLHPYECELDKFEAPKEQLQRVEPQLPKPLDTTELVYISELPELQKLLRDLEAYDELAVDLEHHSYRTYQGITCLMQISTRDKDYIIDTLALREDLHILNLVFTNPKKLKVFHGADSDIEWLQRDLSLYVVNMFDTHRAARKLEFARYSLAFLLKHYCNIEADKTFQLADWRIRPLPQKLIDYARQDTHNLLYVYDRLRNELIDRSAGKTHVVKSVYTESTLLCKKKYVKPVVTETSHMVLYYKSKRAFDNRQLSALKELFLWRDKIARLEDESIGYVLPQHMLLQIAESLPREMQGILACCNPIPPLVRQHLQVLHYIVLKAREQPLVKPITNEEHFRPQITGAVHDLENPLNCPHDLSHSHEGRQEWPTLLGSVKQSPAVVESAFCQAHPKLSVFCTPENSEGEEESPKLAPAFVSPYQRYISVLPFAEEEKRREQARQDSVNRSKVLCPERLDAPAVVQPKIEPTDEETEYALPLREVKKRQREEQDRVRRANLQAAVMESVAKKFKVEEPQPEEPTRKRKRSEEENVDDGELEEVEVVKEEIIEVETDTEDVGPAQLTDTPSCSSASGGSSKKKSNKKQKARKSSDFRQNSNKPIPFDYSKVDFSRFQGGSKQPAQNQTGFMGFKKQKEQQASKGGPKRFNQMNKNMFSFAGFQGKKKK